MKKFSRRRFLLAGAAAVAAPVVARATLFTPFKPEFMGLQSYWRFNTSDVRTLTAAEVGADGGFIVPKELVADLEKMIHEFETHVSRMRVIIDHRFTEIEARMARSRATIDRSFTKMEKRLANSERTVHGFSRS